MTKKRLEDQPGNKGSVAIKKSLSSTRVMKTAENACTVLTSPKRGRNRSTVGIFLGDIKLGAFQLRP